MSFPARPSPAPTDVIERIASIGPLAKCLESAITELEEEEDDLPSDDFMSRPNFDSSMKDILLKRYKDSVAQLSWDETVSPSSTKLKSFSKDKCTKSPPAGLLSGKLQYYNRVGGQWRIVLSDAEIRPRISHCEDSDRTKNQTSLWDCSAQKLTTSSDTIKLENVIILAYDDM
jgi:hypothetical protein